MECRPLEPQQTELESFMDVALLGSRVHGGEFYRTKGSGLTINGSVESFVDRKLSDEEDMVEEVVCDRSRDPKKKSSTKNMECRPSLETRSKFATKIWSGVFSRLAGSPRAVSPDWKDRTLNCMDPLARSGSTIYCHRKMTWCVCFVGGTKDCYN